jgi:chromosome segregation ATPase
MDVERTIEYILQMQAKSEARMAKYDERMDKFDKRLEGMRKLVETGMRMLVKIEKSQDELTVKLTVLTDRVDALTEAQRKSDRKFERFMDSWTKQRTNGHPPKS